MPETELKALEYQNSVLMGENAKLKLSVDLLKGLLQRCKNCGHRLRLIDFNDESCIVVCDYPTCLNYRNPVGRIDRGKLSELLGEAVGKTKIKKKKVTGKIGRPKKY